MKLFQWTVCFYLLTAVPAIAQSAAQLEANKKLAQKFFQSFGNPAQLNDLIHPDYVQHNPVVKAWDDEHHASGRDGLLKFMQSGGFGPPPGADKGKKQAPPPAPKIVLTTAEGDIVTVVWKMMEKDKAGAPYEAFNFDTWRVKDGKLYEHWDGARR